MAATARCAQVMLARGWTSIPTAFRTWCIRTWPTNRAQFRRPSRRPQNGVPMIDFAGRGLRPSLPAACLLAVTLCLGLAGCGSTTQPQHVPMPDESEDYTPKKEFSILDPFAAKEFREVETALPAPPRDADLIPFEVSPAGNFTFAIDGKSVAVGADGAVRYTVVI